MDKQIISIKNYKGDIGVLSTNSYILRDTLKIIKDIIDNYNLRLINENLPNVVLVHRMFEKENANLSHYSEFSDRYKLMEGSRKYVDKNFSSYDWPRYSVENEKMGVIGFTVHDIEQLKDEASSLAFIDLSKKQVFLIGFTYERHVTDYCSDCGIPYASFELDTVPNCNMEHFAFNEVEERLEFIEKNHVWRKRGDFIVTEID